MKGNTTQDASIAMKADETVYNYSSICEQCGKIVNPVERVFSGDTGICAECRNKEFSKRLKNGMAQSHFSEARRNIKWQFLCVDRQTQS